MDRSAQIGIFDSGAGGLTVLHAIQSLLPSESLLYFGDTARVPYGNKSPETVFRYSAENTEFLLSKGVKMIVVACNTATAFALAALQKRFALPIIGVIEPGVKAALQASKSGKIAVLGTRGTINSGAYEEMIRSKRPEVEVKSIACPLFVPLVEEQWHDHPVAHAVAGEYLSEIIGKAYDTVLLGCTHYPLLKRTLQNVLGKQVQLVDSAQSCAQAVKELLMTRQLNVLGDVEGTVEYFASDGTTLHLKNFHGPLQS